MCIVRGFAHYIATKSCHNIVHEPVRAVDVNEVDNNYKNMLIIIVLPLDCGRNARKIS